MAVYEWCNCIVHVRQTLTSSYIEKAGWKVEPGRRRRGILPALLVSEWGSGLCTAAAAPALMATTDLEAGCMTSHYPILLPL